MKKSDLAPRASRLIWMTCLAVAMSLALPATASADHAFLGITSRSVSGEDARERDLSSRDGALIQKVYRGTAAYEAGLKRGDIIVEFGGEKVFDDDDLTHLIRDHEIGEDVSIVVIRDSDRMTLNATLGSYREYEDDDDESSWVVALENMFGGGHRDSPRLGVHVMELNRQLAEYFEVSDERGVLITQVVRRSAAEEAGIRAGDVVLRVADERIYGPGDISDALEDRFGETVPVSLIRKGRAMEIQVQLEDD